MPQKILEECYKGVASSHNKAVFWYLKAAEQGNGEAKEELDMLRKGFDVQ